MEDAMQQTRRPRGAPYPLAKTPFLYDATGGRCPIAGRSRRHILVAPSQREPPITLRTTPTWLPRDQPAEAMAAYAAEMVRIQARHNQFSQEAADYESTTFAWTGGVSAPAGIVHRPDPQAEIVDLVNEAPKGAGYRDGICLSAALGLR
jgi:hypothetical protein